MVELSIVIPTYKEEKYLPKLLNCLRKQTYKDFEVIVADKPFKDKTRKIAREFKCKIVNGGLPSYGRNEGAKIANGDYILFLDADVRFEKYFIEKYLNWHKSKNLGSSTCWSFSYDKTHKFDSFIVYNFMNLGNLLIFLTQGIKPSANGFCIMIKKNIHDKINGFDEKIEYGEDSEYVQRAKNFGKFAICLRTAVYPSIRRFTKNGPIKMCLKYIYLITKREFVGYDKKNAKYFEESAR
jgi:glycosyltransferase involved in cell wall biosynthesis